MSLMAWTRATKSEAGARWRLSAPHLVVGSRFLGLKLIHEWIVDQIGEAGVDREELSERVRRGSHPLVFAADVSGITDTREARAWLANHTEGYAIIFGLENVTPKAQDVLLKELEESPLSVFIPISPSNVPRLVPTVRSRCDEWVIPDVPAEDLPFVLGHPEYPLAAEAVMLARGDLDRAHAWLFDVGSAELVRVWRAGPEAGLKLLLDAERELSSSLLDALHAALRQYLAVAPLRQRSLPVLVRWPRQRGSAPHRAWLLDQYLLAQAGWYGKIGVPK